MSILYVYLQAARPHGGSVWLRARLAGSLEITDLVNHTGLEDRATRWTRPRMGCAEGRPMRAQLLRPTYLEDVVLDVADLNGFAAVPILL